MTGLAAPMPVGSDGFGVVASLRELIALRSAPLGAQSQQSGLGVSPGGHVAQRRSRGMEFAEARPYQPGDDVRAVDWRQSARRGRLYTKLFQEEHERPVQLLVDLGPSMRFGTRAAFKSVVAARAAARLAWATVAAGDRVGGIVWDGGMPREIRAQGRHHGALALLRSLADASAAAPAVPPDNLAVPLRALAYRLRSGGTVMLISDFLTLDTESERQIVALAKGAELVLIHVYDVFEAKAPEPGCYRLSDGERTLTLDLHSAAARAAYGTAFAARRTRLEQLARSVAAPLICVATDCDLSAALLPALQRRPGFRAPAFSVAP